METRTNSKDTKVYLSDFCPVYDELEPEKRKGVCDFGKGPTGAKLTAKVGRTKQNKRNVAPPTTQNQWIRRYAVRWNWIRASISGHSQLGHVQLPEARLDRPEIV